MANTRSYLLDLEDRLKVSRPNTWSMEASAALNDLRNIRLELRDWRRGSKGMGSLESWLVDLEGKLKGAEPSNWSQNSPAARRLVGEIRLELQRAERSLSREPAR